MLWLESAASEVSSTPRVNRAGVHQHNRSVEFIEHLLRDTEIERVLAQGWEVLDLLPLQLNAQYVRYVAPGECRPHVVPHADAKALDMLWNERFLVRKP